MRTLNDLLQAAIELLRLVARPLFQFVGGHANGVRSFLLFVVIGVLAWNGYRHAVTRHLTILSGPRGGSGVKDAKTLASKFEESSRSYKEAFSVTIQSTAGFEENRQLIEADTEGTMIAFAHDGFGESAKVRVLLPLEFNFLHVICHRDFLREVRPASPPETRGAPWTFDEIVPLLRTKVGRVYFGPRESGTRQVAEMVANHFNLPIKRLSSYSHPSFDDMRIALLRRDIDVAFYCGPLNADIMRSIAEDGQSVLVGLATADRNAIMQSRPNLSAANITAQSYIHGEFCPGEVPTVASRRVIICSRQMSDRLAFRLASISFEALRDVLPELQRLDAAPLATSTQLTYRFHPGAEKFRLDQPISWLPASVQSIVGLLLIWSITEALVHVNKRLKANEPPGNPPDQVRPAGGDGTPVSPASPPPPSPSPPSVPSVEFTSLQHRIERRANELPAPPDRLTRKDRVKLLKDIDQLMDAVRRDRDNGRLSDKEFESLVVGVEKELRSRLARKSVASSADDSTLM